MVLVGIVCAPHGIRGCVKIRTFLDDPRMLGDYGPLYSEGTEYNISVLSVFKNGLVLAQIRNIDNRCAAEALKHVKLYVPEAALPTLRADEFYRSNIVGVAVKLLDGSHYGVVTEVFNFGTCDILEISTQTGRKVLLPFTEDVFPNIDNTAKEIVAIPPSVVGSGR